MCIRDSKTERGGSAADFVAIGSKITFTLTAKAEKKVASGQTVGTEYKLTLTNGSFHVSNSTDKNWKATAGAVETQFGVTALAADVVYIGASDSISVTYTVQSATAVDDTALTVAEVALASS